jgi:hypothetical protein
MMHNWEFNHLGMMVTDRDEILSYYQSIGLGVSVGPQPLLPYIEGEGEITFFKELDGEPVSHRFVTGGAHNFKDGQSQIGNCQLEVYPMRPGPGMFISRYLETKGDGINHIAFNTTDIDRDTQFFIDRGCDLVFNVTTNGKTVENYIDTRLHGDLMISLRPPADTWEKSWRKNNESHPLVNKWKFLGLGICVNDLESASDYYSKLGYKRIEEKKVRKECKITSQEFYVSNILFELIHAAKDSIYKNSLAQRGDGVAEMIFQVPDLKTEMDLLKIKGAKILKVSDDKKTAYVDSSMKGNLLTRLIEAE